MNNSELISKLALNIKPVKVVKSPHQSLLRWLGLSFLWLVLGIVIVGIRKDILYVYKHVTFITYLFVLLVLAISSAYSGLSFSIPDKRARSLYCVPFCLLASWIILIVVSVNELTPSRFEEGLMCVRDIFIFSSVPGALLFRSIKQGSVLQSTITGILCLLGAGGIGTLATQFTCQDSFGFHHLIWHVPPVVALGLTGILVGRKLRALN